MTFSLALLKCHFYKQILLMFSCMKSLSVLLRTNILQWPLIVITQINSSSYVTIVQNMILKVSFFAHKRGTYGWKSIWFEPPKGKICGLHTSKVWIIHILLLVKVWMHQKHIIHILDTGKAWNTLMLWLDRVYITHYLMKKKFKIKKLWKFTNPFF